MADNLTVVFWPESAAGPTNNCIGVGAVLRDRGHRVVFAAESSWKGELERHGFEERLIDLAAPSEQPQDAGQFWKDFIAETAPEFRKPTIEQLETVTLPIWQELADGARYSQPALEQMLDDVKPDVVVEDNVIAFPALLTAGAPFVRLMSCNPLEARDPGLPPPYSGLPTDDPSRWEEFRREFDRTHRPLWSDFNEFVTSCGAPPLPELEFLHTSDRANLYLYPQVLDYDRRQPLGPNWHRLESSVRATDEPFEVPTGLQDGEGALVYLSLGSLGSADVGLMNRLIGLLADTPHRYIVSKGPRHDEFELADNMWGAETVPQTTVLPKVDLVITHGGNNTTTESVHFAKPMVVLPLFWDQYDNAQRVHEQGLGVRLDTYGFEDAELTGAIDRLLSDRALRTRLDEVAQAVRGAAGTKVAADAIQSAGRRAR